MSRGFSVKTEVTYGTPAEEILRSAAGANADLIVMSTCSRNDLQCLLGGSVVHKVTREARLPVLLVQAKVRGREEQRNEESTVRVGVGAKEFVAQGMGLALDPCYAQVPRLRAMGQRDHVDENSP